MEPKIKMKLEIVLEKLFQVAEMTGEGIRVHISKPAIDGSVSYKIASDTERRTGEIWRGFSDSIYISDWDD